MDRKRQKTPKSQNAQQAELDLSLVNVVKASQDMAREAMESANKLAMETSARLAELANKPAQPVHVATGDTKLTLVQEPKEMRNFAIKRDSQGVLHLQEYKEAANG